MKDVAYNLGCLAFLILSGFLAYLMVRGVIALLDWWWNDTGTAVWMALPIIAGLAIAGLYLTVKDYRHGSH